MFYRKLLNWWPAPSATTKTLLVIEKMRLVTIIFILTLTYTTTFASYKLTYKDKNFLFTLTIDSALSGDMINYDCFVKTISVTRLSDNKAIQTIIPKENYTYCGFPSNQLFFIEDINFDGHNDIRFIKLLPASPNIPYYFWTFNSKTQLFEQDTTLENITDPTFDYDDKTVYSSWRDGCCTHGSDTYKYINGKITLIKQSIVTTDTETNKQTIITKKLVSGQLIEVERKVE